MTKRAFGDLEQSILNILRSGRRTTVHQMLETLGGKDKYTTIMTVMTRLVDKGLLARERVGLRYEYWFAQDQENQRSLFKRLRSKLFGVKTVDMVSYLIDEANDLSSEDLEKVEGLITSAKKRRGDNE